MRRALTFAALAAFPIAPIAQRPHRPAAAATAVPSPKQLKQALITRWLGEKLAWCGRARRGRSSGAAQLGPQPPSCPLQAAATAGLLFSSRVAGDRPAAMSTIATKGSFFTETLVSVSAGTGGKAFKQVVPPGCAKVKVRHGGKNVTVRIIKVRDLPAIPGATVTAVKTTLSPSPWGHLPRPELMITVVRSGSLVMERRSPTPGTATWLSGISARGILRVSAAESPPSTRRRFSVVALNDDRFGTDHSP
ncbi:hypothetical protein [Nonomuraea sp. SYSU D8015]|uniref:hypothetical protein n=1 Tax=Nonomuraea sp. SYSU D8015 TaxID=2593644 RepID=UPI001660D84D|nr:hypothetical protein [Nonomuraea sp. SYSU D8015]